MMKIQKILFSIAIACFVLAGCKNEPKKEVEKTNTVATDTQKLTLAISGMTCEIGCAKIIQSKLSKKEGIVESKVVFKDSLASISYDANKISKQEIMAFVDGIAGGGFYKTSEHKACKTDCKKACCTNKVDKKECKKTCSSEKDAHKECKANCKKACCTEKKSS